jgi:hypothetical protein
VTNFEFLHDICFSDTVCVCVGHSGQRHNKDVVGECAGNGSSSNGQHSKSVASERRCRQRSVARQVGLGVAGRRTAHDEARTRTESTESARVVVVVVVALGRVVVVVVGVGVTVAWHVYLRIRRPGVARRR